MNGERAGRPDLSRDKLHGRKRGRRLRPGRARALETALAELAFDLPEGGTLAPRRLFPAPVDGIWLEVGFGAGEHLAAQARANPRIGFIGCEVYLNGVARLAAEIARDRLENVRFFTGDAALLLRSLPEASLERSFVLFPDPWPKMRHWKRRFVGPANLAALARALADGAELRLATDHPDYLIWMLQHLLAAPEFEWLARQSVDWRVRPPDWPATRFEAKARAEGRPSTYLRFRRVARAGGPLPKTLAAGGDSAI